MIKKFNEYEHLNEWYNNPDPKDVKKKDKFSFDIPARTYVDKVFDHIVNIECHVNFISEKDFRKYDDKHDEVKKIFDENQNIITVINEFEKRSARYEYCAEFIYDKYFKSN